METTLVEEEGLEASKELWPEALRDRTRPNPFPTRIFWKWLTSGIILFLLLIGLNSLLQQEGNDQIVYLSSNGTLSMVQANGIVDDFAGGERYQLKAFTSRTIEAEDVPIIGSPQWAGDGRYLIATVNGKEPPTELILLNSRTHNVISIATTYRADAPANSWSNSGQHLAWVEHDDIRPLLTIANREDLSSPAFYDFTLHPLSGFDWQPTQGINQADQDQMLVTAANEEGVPQLKLVNTLGDVLSMNWQEPETARWDGRWSPNGEQIAFVSAESFTSDENPLMLGDILISNADGSGATVIVPGGQNFAPEWSPNGEAIFFTQFISESNRFELKQVDVNGQGLRDVGPSSILFRFLSYERDLFFAWSPNGRHLAYIAENNQGQQQIYQFLAGEMEATPLPSTSQCTGSSPFSLEWMPTSRALLLACPSRGMSFYAINTDESFNELGVSGTMPSWQP